MDPEVTPAESIEVPVSDEGGNVPAEPAAPAAPSPAPKEPAAAAEPAAPAPTAAPELFDLPDGRKVDAATLAKEFKENFLPEFTRKSQELAKLTTPKPAEITKPASPLQDPNYVPQTYQELAKAIQEDIALQAKLKEEAAAAEKLALETAVTEQLNAVKAIDKNVDETKLFQHATKYGFRDLKLAHQNMTDMAKLAKDVKQTTAKDVLKRNDPVSVTPGAAGGARPDPNHFATARDYLRSLQQ